LRTVFLGSISELNIGNPWVLTTTYGYYGVRGTNNATGGYYGRLWAIKTVNSGATVLQDEKYGCDANQNGTIDMGDVVFILNNLLSAYYTAYNALGNITSMRGKSYIYGTKPHAVTRVGTTAYTYDNNGNMLTGDGRTITWDVENRPVTVIKAGVTTTFVYDGDGNRVKQTVGGVVTTYVNKYYEKTGAVVTTNYYFGGKLIAVRKNAILSYIMQDSLGSISGTVNSTTGARDSTITYCPFGTC
jgi:YD repeat-containing protein